jgi:hypothetical protein
VVGAVTGAAGAGEFAAGAQAAVMVRNDAIKAAAETRRAAIVRVLTAGGPFLCEWSASSIGSSASGS